MAYRFPLWHYSFLVAGIACCILAFVQQGHLYRQQTNYNEIRRETEERLNKEEARVNVFLDNLERTFKSGIGFSRNHSNYLNSITEQVSGFTLFVFYKDSLRYWSSNNVLVSYEEVSKIRNGQCAFVANGYYEIFKRLVDDKLIVALFNVKNEFAFENQYLENNFNPILGLPSRARISQVKSEKILPIKNLSGELLFSLSFLPVSDETEQLDGEDTVGTLYLVSIILIMVFAFLITYYLLKVKPIIGLLLLIVVSVIRILGIEHRIPESMYELPLFSPRYYASSYMLYSLGDLLLSSIVFCYIITSLYYYYDLKKDSVTYKAGKTAQSVYVVAIWLFTFVFSVLINYLLSSLIINSKISFNINNIFELTGFSLVGFLVIGVLLFSFYLVCDGGIRYILRADFSLARLGILFLITQGLFLIILINLRDSELFRNYGISAFLLANLLILFIGFIRDRTGRAFSFTRSILFIFGFSVYAAQTIFVFNVKREQENRKALASKLENAQDAIAEYLFDELTSKAKNDKYLTTYFSATYPELVATAANSDVLYRRMTQQYFSGYWAKYDIRIKSFTGDGLPINTSGDPSWNLDYFDKLIETSARPTYSAGFYALNSETGHNRYIGKINIPSPVVADSIIGTLVFEMSSKFLKDNTGYPDLLISSKVPITRDVTNYSYARYRNGELITQFGKNSYDLISDFYLKNVDPNAIETFAEFDNLSHLFYRPNKETLIIVSTSLPGPLELVTLFSYIFSFFCLLFILIYVIARVIAAKFRLRINFKTRIQFTVMSIVVTAMLVIGASTVAYIMNNYSNTQDIKLRDKLNSTLVAISKDIADYNMLGGNLSDELSSKFQNLNRTADIDFNIFNNSGYLVYTSQPKLFEQQIISPTMNRIVFRDFNNAYRSNYVSFEYIGLLGFFSGYAAIRNIKNEVIGYMSLPYFTRESELKKEISSFLVALINIYVLLFAISVVITFFISNRITSPLKIIQDRMSKVKLGKRNERIVWKNEDEIGTLINEYNRMIDELSDSAQRLAKSERETAWREMAKQVAHEIKNPLTPMKLSVQHVQRAWKDKHKNMDEIVQRFSQTLIDQIDALSGIATEFSNFAKMPGALFAPVNISQLLKNSVNLYSENEQVSTKLYDFTKGDLEVFADKDQLLRVFSNLLKNAIQAVPDDKDGRITVKITNDDTNCIVSVQDNGSGIPEDKIQKIFTPNFTTKSGGTGLGLAMVKNIVENSNGKIWFDTEVGKGTTFYIMLPEYKGIEIA